MRRAIVIAALLVLGAAGCRKEQERPAEGPPPGPPPLSEAEARQVRDACDAYVAHVCACAAARPEDVALGEQCGLARAIPGALDVAIGAAQARQDSPVDAEGVRGNVGKIQKSCIEEGARLETSCPRASLPPE
jgi:hypothetical protein